LAAGLTLAACLSTVVDDQLPAPPPGLIDPAGELKSTVLVDRERHEVTLIAGPFDVPAMAMEGHGHGHGSENEDLRSPVIPFQWPVDGGLQGVRMALRDADTNQVPRDIIHHLIGVNFDRRQLVYPVIERTFGFGTETEDVALPDFLEVPVNRGDSLGVWVMWNNTTGEELHGVVLQVVLPYAAPGKEREAVFPIYMDTNNQIGVGTSFDIPPGEFTKSFEFELPVGGGLLASSGHLHDYGRELRLEKAETGEILFRLKPDRDEDGKVTSIERKVFRRFFGLLDSRIPLERGVRYRVVGIYENPTGETIADGGMAHIVGLFAPESTERWPTLDRSLPVYQRDMEHLPPKLGHRGGR
jgi:hypothetical protein